MSSFVVNKIFFSEKIIQKELGMNNEYTTKKDFFASSNSYYGFKSYFDKIFDSSKFDRIFVLKGGPGTGKSTLMKKVANSMKNSNLNIELFWCSSDPLSLDGLIIENERNRIAILDGTAPHERDAIIPGAIDVIVNLGDSLNINELKERRKEILSLNDLKRGAYRTAYQKLSKSSIIYSNIKAELLNSVDLSLIDAKCNELIKTVIPRSGLSDVRLFSSFSKNGYSRVSSFIPSLDNCYTISESHGFGTVFLTLFSQKLTSENISFIKIISPKDPESVEGIYFKDSNFAILSTNEKEVTLNTEDFIKTSEKNALTEKLQTLKNCISIYESEAVDALREASVQHFELENIYTEAVNFEIINNYTENIISELSKIFI